MTPLRRTLLASACAWAASSATHAQEPPLAPTATLCLAAEYVYAGSRLLAVAKGPLPTVTLAATSSFPNEATGTAPVGLVVNTPGGCPIDGNVIVQYATGAGTATAGTDYVAVPAGSLTIPAGTPSGVPVNLNVALVNDALDEDPETFTVNLSLASGAVLGPPSSHTVTIVDDDPEPSLTVADASTVEPARIVTTASHAVTLTPVSGRTVTVQYGTGGGTATPQSPTTAGDYQPTAGTLTFPAGATSRTVGVPINPDDVDEPAETYLVNLSGAVNATVSDATGLGTIVDSDPPPSVSVANATRNEGDEGTNRMDFVVTLSGPSAFPVTVNYATASGTAQETLDYVATSGQLSFAPGDTVRQPLVTIVTDAVPEPTEQFFVNLAAPVNAVLGSAQGVGTIVNDDPAFVSSVELTHGTRQTQSLAAEGGAAATHWYRIGQKARSSYEVVADATSGDIGTDFGLLLTRFAWDQTTVLQESVAVAPDAAGKGHSKTLRWRNWQHFGVNGQFLRVRSAQCGTDCGRDDLYRLRAFDTTYSVARFNNVGTQVTVLQLQNTSSSQVGATVDFWDGNGNYLTSEILFLPAKASVALNTALSVPGQSGSITIMNDAGYGELAGKGVSIEPATGYSFDTPMLPRPR